MKGVAGHFKVGFGGTQGVHRSKHLGSVLPALLLLSLFSSLFARAPAPSDRVALRLLVVSATATDPGLAAWEDLLQRLGTPFDTFIAADEPLTRDLLVAPDGGGRYYGVLLADGSLSHRVGDSWQSAFSADEWALLWAYERDYRVRQVALYSYPGTAPEDYGLRLVGTMDVGENALSASLSPAGQKLFSYLRPDALLPVRQARVFLAARVAQSAEPLLTDEAGHVLAALAPSGDGRERLVLTVAQGPQLLHTQLLGYGLVRWVTRGLFLGERRVFLQVDVDDWFQESYRWNPATKTAGPERFRLSARDALAARAQQQKLRAAHPRARSFALTLAFVGFKADLAAPASCDPAALSAPDNPDPLTSATRCVADHFNWLNHTFTEQVQDSSDYAAARADIEQNNQVAAALGLKRYSPSVLLTSGHSGLGYYPPEAPVDHGLAASNIHLLRAAKDAGVRFLGANRSVPSQSARCAGCGVAHPLEPDLLLVPRYPTNVFVSTTTPAEAVSAYNSVYGPQGSAARWSEDLSYEAYLNEDTDVALRHLLTFSPYPHFFHQANLHEYAPDRSLVFDWLDALLTKYDRLYTLPLVTLPWDALGEYVAARTAFEDMNVEAVWNRKTHELRVSAPRAGPVFLTGAKTGDSVRYGEDVISSFPLAAGEVKTLKVTEK